jgi:hypothetical protein
LEKNRISSKYLFRKNDKKTRDKKTENFRNKCKHYKLDENENLIYIEKLNVEEEEFIIPSEIQKNELLKNIMKLWDIQVI